MGMACGGGSSTGPPPPDAPVVTSINLTTASPGDTLIITGSHFSTTTAENTVTFTNPASGTNPFWATATQMGVLVDRDATNGQVTVKTSGGSGRSPQSLSVTRGVGDMFVFSGSGSTVLRLPNPTASTNYLVIPHSVNSALPTTTSYAYKIETQSAPPVAATSPLATVAAGAPMDANERFEALRWENAQRTLDRYGPPAGPERGRVPATAAAPAATRQFYVLKTVNGSQDASTSYAHVTAQLRYTGTKCLVYSDIDTLPTGNFAQAHYDLFGQTYDNSIEQTNVSYFGPYSDVDANGKLIMLVTPVVNRLEENCSPNPQCTCGFIAGFFNPRDLYDSPPVPAGTTNHAEIIYLLAADPNGFWDCSFPVNETASENLSTIPHEHQHLTSFSWRIFHEGGTTQVTWLEEGMAHMAEDLNGDNSSNAKRGQIYRTAPNGISLEDNHAPLAQRGGIYLMLRLLADRYGTGILKNIVQSKCTGRSCIENVTGETFSDVMAEFLAAQYLSGKGITNDARFNYQPPLNFTNSNGADYFGALTVGLHAAGGPVVNGTLRRASGQFHTFTGVAGEESTFQFIDVSGSAQLRDVIMRIQ
jgi:hypothetical protein